MLSRYKERFLEMMPDFADFTVRSGTYWIAERQYKEEISELCKELLPSSLFETQDTAFPDRVYDAIKRILTGKLQSTGAPQNIVGWRNYDSLRKHTVDDRRIFAESLGDLLYGPGEPSDRIDPFSDRMWPIFKRNESSNPFARSRIIPTFFLMMTNPSENVTVRTDLFKQVSSDLLGRPILRNQVFTGAEYTEALSLAGSVTAQLERWGWCPTDFIDAHSFLWSAAWEYEEEEEEEEEKKERAIEGTE